MPFMLVTINDRDKKTQRRWIRLYEVDVEDILNKAPNDVTDSDRKELRDKLKFRLNGDKLPNNVAEERIQEAGLESEPDMFGADGNPDL